VEAEYQLIAANSRIGAARAAFFPRIALTGLVGLASTALTSLISGGAFNFSGGVNASVPIFDAGANRGNLDYARAQRELFVARYEQTIQTAFREVGDALARRGTMADQFAAQTRLVADAQDNYRLTEARYREGIENFLATLVAQRTLYAAQQSLARTRLERAVNLADLYRTIGGDSLIETHGFAPAGVAPPPAP
jgi:multidrug efflux system outer membrane protein